MFFEAPGFKLLSRVLVARVSGALILAYVSLRGFHYHFEIITTALIVLWMRQKFATNQDTKVCGALTPPQVKESSFKIISSLKVNHETGDLSNAFHEWSKQYGNTFTIKIFGQTRIMTLEPDHLKAILATKFDDFWKGPIQEENFNSFLGSGVFNSDDKMWK
ncbi:Protein kinase alk2 [Stygiomarasmius scandens]|uniref:Protein kinase alk2 n=1 Tax=Marasmiellus scandens TaxID=2682957 RepID=A0ABR1IY09_9AGAR